MSESNFNNFYLGKKVFLTGHTGFKGAWLSLWLNLMGAKVCGFSLRPEKESLFNILQIGAKIDKSLFGDICNQEEILIALKNFQPEIVIHFAAQSLVRPSYANPRDTFKTNVIGTLNVFEAARKAGGVKAFLNITTDKCYENREIDYAYSEEDALGGYDPYSASKACAEILTSSYRRSFFAKEQIALASARAGNVIGGGDFCVDRIVPDIFRAIRSRKKVELRNPGAIRPWQHVLEPLFGYLLLIKKLYENGESFAKAYNFGPEKNAQQNVETLTKVFIKNFGECAYEAKEDKVLHEAGILKLNNSRAKKELNWRPKLTFDEALSWSASWYKNYLENSKEIIEFTLNQIKQYEGL